jgi:hypothetical protein
MPNGTEALSRGLVRQYEGVRDNAWQSKRKIRAYEDASRWGAPRESLLAENRHNTIACGRHGAGVPIALTIGRVI